MSDTPDGRLDPVFVALSDPTRRSVIQLLASGQATATQLASRFPVTRQAIAKHLQVLHEAGLVVSARRGRETHWTLTPAPLSPAVAWMQDVGAGFDDRVAALQRHLDDRRTEREHDRDRPRPDADRGFPPPMRIAASSRVNRPQPPRRERALRFGVL